VSATAISSFRLSSDYVQRLQQVKAAYPKAKRPKSTRNTRSILADVVREKDGVATDIAGDAAKRPIGNGHRRCVSTEMSDNLSVY
jgi:hypothetical protein